MSKRIILSVLIIGFLAFAPFATKAITLGDLEDMASQIKSLTEEISNLKAQLLTAQVRLGDESLKSVRIHDLPSATLTQPLAPAPTTTPIMIKLSDYKDISYSSFLRLPHPIVYEMQKALSEQGYKPGSWDSIPGPTTWYAFQQQITAQAQAPVPAPTVPAITPTTPAKVIAPAPTPAPTPTPTPTLADHYHLIDYERKDKIIGESARNGNLIIKSLSCPAADEGLVALKDYVVLSGGYNFTPKDVGPQGGDLEGFVVTGAKVAANGYEITAYDPNQKIDLDNSQIHIRCARLEPAVHATTAHFPF